MSFSKKDFAMFDLARRAAENSNFEGFHLGCVIVYKGRVISSGYNSKKTHPVQKRYNRKYRKFNKSQKPIVDSLHAEISALVKIPYPLDQTIDYSQVKVYTYRICPGKRLKMGSSRPCQACMNALLDKGIRQIYYTTDDGFCCENIY